MSKLAVLIAGRWVKGCPSVRGQIQSVQIVQPVKTGVEPAPDINMAKAGIGTACIYRAWFIAGCSRSAGLRCPMWESQLLPLPPVNYAFSFRSAGSSVPISFETNVQHVAIKILSWTRAVGTAAKNIHALSHNNSLVLVPWGWSRPFCSNVAGTAFGQVEMNQVSKIFIARSASESQQMVAPKSSKALPIKAEKGSGHFGTVAPLQPPPITLG
mmetsp:Transcript_42072/g.69508  ORF Transcript_42072/g.69508 Transcript_42072/m.69508 type:complete len:213 (-) Transcript_42072:1108-1746(-)